MELQDNPDQNVNERVRAEAGKVYPIRLLHLTNGMIIIGFVIEVLPTTVLMLRPYIVEVEYDPEAKNITSYDFEPYLNQLTQYDANTLDPIPFVLTNIFSITVPATHLLENYNNIIAMKSMVSVDAEKLKIRRREYLNDKTVH